MKKKHLFIICFITILTFTSLILTILIHDNWHKKYLNHQSNSNIRIINNVIDNFFINIWRIAEDKGRKIANNKAINKNIIQQHFKRQFSYISQSSEISPAFLWPRFLWLDKNNKITVNSYLGIIQDPINIDLEPYHFLASQNPWQLYFSKLQKEDITSKKIFKAALGVSNDQKEYLGSIIIRFEIDKIIQRINDALGQKDHNYLILDTNFNEILISNNSSNFQTNFSILKKFFTISDTIINLQNPILIGDITYNKLLKLSNHPFVILSGYNHKIYHHKLLLDLGKYLFITISILLGFILSIYLIYKFLLKDIAKLKTSLLKIRSSNQTLKLEKSKLLNAKKLSDDFSTGITQTIDQPTSLIKADIEKLVIVETSNVVMTKDTRMDIYYNMLDNLEIIKSFATNQLLFEEINIVNLTKEAIEHHNHAIIKDKIKIDFKYNKNIKKISADKLRFVQIISNLIYISLIDLPRSKIAINISNIKKKDKRYLKITIIDDGNGLCETDRENLMGLDNYQKSLYNIKLQDIRKLIALHEGELNINTKHNIGTEFVLLLPYKRGNEDIVENEKEDNSTAKNVIFLHKKKS